MGTSYEKEGRNLTTLTRAELIFWGGGKGDKFSQSSYNSAKVT
jgi:hypothetical protein